MARPGLAGEPREAPPNCQGRASEGTRGCPHLQVGCPYLQVGQGVPYGRAVSLLDRELVGAINMKRAASAPCRPRPPAAPPPLTVEASVGNVPLRAMLWGNAARLAGLASSRSRVSYAHSRA